MVINICYIQVTRLLLTMTSWVCSVIITLGSDATKVIISDLSPLNPLNMAMQPWKQTRWGMCGSHQLAYMHVDFPVISVFRRILRVIQRKSSPSPPVCATYTHTSVCVIPLWKPLVFTTTERQCAVRKMCLLPFSSLTVSDIVQMAAWSLCENSNSGIMQSTECTGLEEPFSALTSLSPISGRMMGRKDAQKQQWRQSELLCPQHET